MTKAFDSYNRFLFLYSLTPFISAMLAKKKVDLHDLLATLLTGWLVAECQEYHYDLISVFRFIFIFLLLRINVFEKCSLFKEFSILNNELNFYYNDRQALFR